MDMSVSVDIPEVVTVVKLVPVLKEVLIEGLVSFDMLPVMVEVPVDVIISVELLVIFVVIGDVVSRPVLVEIVEYVDVPERVMVVILVVVLTAWLLVSFDELAVWLEVFADELTVELVVSSDALLVMSEVPVDVEVKMELLVLIVITGDVVSFPVLKDVEVMIEVPEEVTIVVLTEVLTGWLDASDVELDTEVDAVPVVLRVEKGVDSLVMDELRVEDSGFNVALVGVGSHTKVVPSEMASPPPTA
jgi:hypothetical protein